MVMAVSCAKVKISYEHRASFRPTPKICPSHSTRCLFFPIEFEKLAVMLFLSVSIHSNCLYGVMIET